jgi:putative glycosyltransferase
VKLSIVSTLYRSAFHLDEFHRRVTLEASRRGPEYEIVLVNDGSPDDSLARALVLQRGDPHLRIVDLSRNFGHHKAMMTGLAHARGELVFLIDSDLEEDPELLGTFLGERERTGADVVFGVQERRKGSLFEKLSGEAFFRLFNLLSSYPLPRNLTTVRLMTRRYLDALLLHQERETVISGLWAITGFEQVAVSVTKQSRGTSSYSLARRVAHLVDAITSFSDRPLVFVFYLGFGISLLSTLAALYLIVRRVFFGVFLAGWPSVMVSLWLLGGLTLLSLGIIGIYVSRVFVETKQRPYTIVRQLYEPHRS